MSKPADTLYWVDGLLPSPPKSKRERWIPLFCSQGPMKASTMLRFCLEPPATTPAKEVEMLDQFEDFRVRQPDVQLVVTTFPEGCCPECGTREPERIRKGPERLWKCPRCAHRWLRFGPESASAALKASFRTPDAPKVLRAAQKAALPTSLETPRRSRKRPQMITAKRRRQT